MEFQTSFCIPILMAHCNNVRCNFVLFCQIKSFWKAQFLRLTKISIKSWKRSNRMLEYERFESSGRLIMIFFIRDYICSTNYKNISLLFLQQIQLLPYWKNWKCTANTFILIDFILMFMTSGMLRLLYCLIKTFPCFGVFDKWT